MCPEQTSILSPLQGAIFFGGNSTDLEAVQKFVCLSLRQALIPARGGNQVQPRVDQVSSAKHFYVSTLPGAFELNSGKLSEGEVFKVQREVHRRERC